MKLLDAKPLYAYSERESCGSCKSTFLLEQEDIEDHDTCRGREYYITCPVCKAYLRVYTLASYQKRAIRDGVTLPKRPPPLETVKKWCKREATTIVFVSGCIALGLMGVIAVYAAL